MIKEFDLIEFNDELASSSPTPGGGGAAAMAASLAAALGSMVANLTINNKEYSEVSDDVKLLLNKCESARKKLLNLIDEDATAFEPLSRAYKIPKDDPNRDEIMEKCLKTAAEVPMKILRLSCDIIDIHEELSQKGNKLLLSDAGCGAVLAWSSMYAAALNVLVNTKLMKDRAFASSLNNEVEELMNKYWKIADKTYEDVYNKLK